MAKRLRRFLVAPSRISRTWSVLVPNVGSYSKTLIGTSWTLNQSHLYSLDFLETHVHIVISTLSLVKSKPRGMSSSRISPQRMMKSLSSLLCCSRGRGGDKARLLRKMPRKMSRMHPLLQPQMPQMHPLFQLQLLIPLLRHKRLIPVKYRGGAALVCLLRRVQTIDYCTTLPRGRRRQFLKRTTSPVS